jgi:hypothetical protein
MLSPQAHGIWGCSQHLGLCFFFSGALFSILRCFPGFQHQAKINVMLYAIVFQGGYLWLGNHSWILWLERFEGQWLLPLASKPTNSMCSHPKGIAPFRKNLQRRKLRELCLIDGRAPSQPWSLWLVSSCYSSWVAHSGSLSLSTCVPQGDLPELCQARVMLSSGLATTRKHWLWVRTQTPGLGTPRLVKGSMAALLTALSSLNHHANLGREITWLEWVICKVTWNSRSLYSCFLPTPV